MSDSLDRGGYDTDLGLCFGHCSEHLPVDRGTWSAETAAHCYFAAPRKGSIYTQRPAKFIGAVSLLGYQKILLNQFPRPILAPSEKYYLFNNELRLAGFLKAKLQKEGVVIIPVFYELPRKIQDGFRRKSISVAVLDIIMQGLETLNPFHDRPAPHHPK